MEKFDLKWNDFQTTISQYFKQLRDEKDFFDVTLVSEDNKLFQTHKIVLTACSSFFKPILKANVHAHPLIYLSGVDSTNLQFILNYIYEGEVQLYQEQLNSFLNVAQKLQISGLLGDQIEGDEFTDENKEIAKSKNFKKERKSFPEPTENESYFAESKPIAKTVSVIGHNQNEVDQKIRDLITKESDMYKCTVCGKLSNHLANMKRHVEVHIDGLSYSCNICDKTFRNKQAMQSHKSHSHRQI